MTVTQAVKYARRLLDEHGLTEVKVCIGSAKMTLGLARYKYGKPHLLRLSRHLIQLNPDEEVIDTIRHEVAHLLVGVNQGHGAKWQSMARKLGAEPSPCSSSAVMPARQWLIVCGVCNHVCGRRHRRPSMNLATRYCGLCGQSKSLGQLGIVHLDDYPG